MIAITHNGFGYIRSCELGLAWGNCVYTLLPAGAVYLAGF